MLVFCTKGSMVYHLSKPTQPMDKNMGARSLSTCVSSHKFLSAILSLSLSMSLCDCLFLKLIDKKMKQNTTKFVWVSKANTALQWERFAQNKIIPLNYHHKHWKQNYRVFHAFWPIKNWHNFSSRKANPIL